MISLLKHYDINLNQDEVDFLIPFLDKDRRFFIDPAQLRYSEDKMLVEWNKDIDKFLAIVNKKIRSGDNAGLKKLLNIGESKDIGLGYCAEGHKGSGFGAEISDQVIRVLAASDEFKKKGIQRIEEIQWLDKYIGADRVGDFAANILKNRIIEYTIEQAAMLPKLKTRKVRVHKVFDFDREEWVTRVAVVPVNELVTVIDPLCPHPPVLLLPKESIKALPLFLSYDAFYGFIDPDYKKGKKKSKLAKETVVLRVLNNPTTSEDFIKTRERDLSKLYRTNFDDRLVEIVEKIETIPVGARGAAANEYRALVNELLGIVFEADMELSGEEKSTFHKENRRDGIFYNRGASDVFRSFREKHKAHHIVVDSKNTDDVTAKDVAQISNYLDDNMGHVAFIVSRKQKSKMVAHQSAQKDKKGNIIIQITDEDMKRWVTEITRLRHRTGEQFMRYQPVKSLENKYSDIMML